MKKLGLLFAIILLVLSCKKENTTGYLINGNAEKVHNGIRVRLAEIDNTGKQVIKDSAIVVDGKFTLKGSIEEPSIYFLFVDGSPGNVVFMLENSKIDIDFNKQNPMESKVTGSTSNKSYETFQNGMLQFREKNSALMTEFQRLGMDPAPEKRDSIKKAVESLREEQAKYPLKFIQKNNSSYFSLSLILLESNRPNFDVVKYREVFEGFPSSLKESKKGIEVAQKINRLYKKYEKIAHLEIGKIAPDFEAPTPNGDFVSLNDLKGKVTIIDFWAAWCGPCRKENPNVVKVYEKFHDKGLEIIGVSLDGNSRQPNPKKAWLDAIEKDGLTWNHVSNLKYFQDPVAQLYNIRSIPATYILNEKGEIVAKNLRGKALENKVAELLNAI